MHFKIFSSINNKKNDFFIIFNKNDELLVDADNNIFFNKNIVKKEIFIKIGIAETDDKNIYVISLKSNFICTDNHTFKNIRSLFSILSKNNLNLAGRANQIAHWIKNSQYCGICGQKTEFDNDEKAFIRPCNKSYIYPNINPCILSLIYRDNKILLARNSQFPDNFYSILAGFIEPSESAEDCIKREVFEEVALQVGNIKYFGSQPWPFPSQLMLGYICEYKGGEIKVDGKEIIDAQWFDIENLPLIPPKTTLSGQLIANFVLGHLKHE